MSWQRPRLNRHLLVSFAIGLIGLSACASATEKKVADPVKAPVVSDTSTQSAKTEAEQTKDPASVNFETQRDRSKVLLIGPRPDRDPPLQDCGTLTTQRAMSECAQKNYVRVEDERDFIYQAWQDTLPEAGQTALDSAENAWTRFRDLTCGFERDQFAGGSLAPFIYSSCLTGQTIARTDELYEPKLAQDSYEQADGILNAHYQALQGALSDSRRSELTDAQLAWIEYRDRQCEYEAKYAQVDIQAAQCKARLSEQRTDELQDALEQNSL